MAASTTRRRPRTWAGLLLGFALGGFFDGILLHQILQWHHLLSGLQTGALRSLRVQILADGFFHLLMYAIAVAGLWSLWRSRRAGAMPESKRLLADALIGFGGWHALDAVLSHWLLGLHRIRMEAAEPLVWDLGWLAAFGIVPLLAGIAMRRRGGGDAAVRRSLAGGLLAAGVLVAAPVASLPPRDATQVAVLVRPERMNELLDGVQAAEGGILWVDGGGALWVFSLPPGADAGALYRHGALLVTRSPAALGCLAFVRGDGA
ncbi:MAG TPA: DUF2243 domain-containing protein [Pseudoxanthomonas sp.]|nr:DUF2243 domain-containing protein [Pseudoxanthomonas sp.]